VDDITCLYGADTEIYNEATVDYFFSPPFFQNKKIQKKNSFLKFFFYYKVKGGAVHSFPLD
jgi:hypothetical protein